MFICLTSLTFWSALCFVSRLRWGALGAVSGGVLALEMVWGR